MKCKDIMTENPTFCLPTDSAQKVASLMQEHVCGLIPVVGSESNRKPVGVVTDRDLCLNIVAAGRDPKRVRVEECMTKTAVCCWPEQDVEKCLQLLKENQIRRLPVCDSEGKLIGIIALADIMRKANIPQAEAFETLKAICEPSTQPSKPRHTRAA